VYRMNNQKEVDIAILFHHLGSGGVSKIFLRIAKELSNNFDVEIVTIVDNDSPYVNSDYFKGIEHKNLGAREVRYSFFKLVDYLNSRKPKYLISAMNHVNVVALISSKLSRIPVKNIVSVRNNSSELFKNEDNFISNLMPYFIKLTYPMADEIVAISEGVADDIKKVSGVSEEKISIIHNPVVTRELKEKSKESVDHGFFELGVPVILSVGRLDKQKDYKTLVRSFKQVRKKVDSRLLILGEGNQRAEIQELINELNIKKDVDLPGFVENPYKYMRKSSVFVLSSRWEGFGNVIVEAMATGTPVVSTNCPSGPSEILKNGRYGELVPVGNSKKLADAILRTLKNPNISEKELIKRANEFNIENCISGYKKLLKEN